MTGYTEGMRKMTCKQTLDFGGYCILPLAEKGLWRLWSSSYTAVARTMMVTTQHTAMTAIGMLARPREKGPFTKSLMLSSLMNMGMPSARTHAPQILSACLGAMQLGSKINRLLHTQIRSCKAIVGSGTHS